VRRVGEAGRLERQSEALAFRRGVRRDALPTGENTEYEHEDEDDWEQEGMDENDP
jgi:hypothetical protein